MTLAFLILFLAEYGQMIAEVMRATRWGRWAFLKSFFAAVGHY